MGILNPPVHGVRGPAERGGRQPVQAFRRHAGTLARRDRISPRRGDRGPHPAGGGMGRNVQNPVYITTVWGYGYKWGF